MAPDSQVQKTPKPKIPWLWAAPPHPPQCLLGFSRHSSLACLHTGRSISALLNFLPLRQVLGSGSTCETKEPDGLVDNYSHGPLPQHISVGHPSLQK